MKNDWARLEGRKAARPQGWKATGPEGHWAGRLPFMMTNILRLVEQLTSEARTIIFHCVL
jgi:hypothetical protein